MEHSYPACESSITLITDYFYQKIKSYKINRKLRMEYKLLMEELTTKIIESAEPTSTISIEVKKKLGTITAKITSAGKPVILESESNTDFAGQIIQEYSEYLRQSYSFGINEIVFTTSFSSNEMLHKNIAALIIASVIGLLFREFCDMSRLSWIHENISLPVILIFIRCMQTVAVPVAFFSLAAFVVNIRRTFDRNNKTVRLSFHYLTSSLIAVAIGVAVGFLFKELIPAGGFSRFIISDDNFIGNSLKDFLSQVVSSNLIEPFLISNPIPFLVNALLVGLAASSVFGKSGDIIRNGLTAINDLFARMMNLIYGSVHIFLFVAVFDLVIKADSNTLHLVGIIILSVIVAMLFLIGYYIIRLLIGRVNIPAFFGNYSKLLIDNLKIASNIDSYPYNKRILARKLSLSRNYLAEGLKLGTLLNMDGNCLVVANVLCCMVYAVGVEISPMKYVGIAIIMLLFSVGAPNQPGSLLLGMIILMSFVGISTELVGIILIFEALLSKFYSFLNAAGDIVTMVIEDERHKRLKTSIIK